MQRSAFIAFLVTITVTGALSAQQSGTGLNRQGEPEELDLGDINLGFPDADEDLAAALIEQLGHCVYLKREAAAARLIELGPRAFRYLARSYREGDDYETRVRIEQIVRESFLWHTMLKRRGFLGISFKTDSAGDIPAGSSVIVVETVQPDSAAHEAGLLVGDRIVTIDGEFITADGDGSAFREVVDRKGAGAVLSLEIDRRGARLRVDVTLKGRPLRHYADRLRPELLDDLNRHLQAYGLWWARHFSLPKTKRERAPSSAVLELPE